MHTWRATPKIIVFGDVSFANGDFKRQDEVASAVGGQRRNDDTWRHRIGTRRQARQYVQVSLSHTRQERDSSIDTRDFDDNQVNAKVRFHF